MRARLLAVALVLALAPCALGAQRLRVSIEPRVGALPTAAIWDETAVSRTMTLDPPDPSMPARAVTSRTTSIRRETMALLGASIAIAPAGGRWHVVLEGAAARGDLRTRVTERTDFYLAAGGDPVTGDWTATRERHPVTLAQLGVRAERTGTLRGVALETSAGLLGQRLRTRVTRWVPGPPSTGTMVPVHHRNSYVDPALAAGFAVGPATGRWAALRLGLRSTHVWRSPDIANAYRRSPDAAYDVEGRHWQWQPELMLGWRLRT